MKTKVNGKNSVSSDNETESSSSETNVSSNSETESSSSETNVSSDNETDALSGNDADNETSSDEDEITDDENEILSNKKVVQIPKGSEWIFDGIPKLPEKGLPVNWENTKNKHAKTLYNPDTQVRKLVDKISKKKKQSNKQPIGFIKSTQGNNSMPGTNQPAAVRFQRLYEKPLHDYVVTDNHDKSLVPCIVHGDYVKIESLAADHAQSKDLILKRQKDLVDMLNADKNFATYVLSQPKMKDFFVFSQEENKYFGTVLFYETYFNAIENIWLICNACNTEKSNQDPLVWLKKQWMYGNEFSEYLNTQGINENGILIKTDNKNGLAEIAINWFWERHVNYMLNTKTIQKEVVIPLQKQNIKLDKLEGSKESDRTERLTATLSARLTMIEQFPKAKIGMQRNPNELKHNSSEEEERMPPVKDKAGNVISITPKEYIESARTVAQQLPGIAARLLKENIIENNEKKIKEQKQKGMKSKNN